MIDFFYTSFITIGEFKKPLARAYSFFIFVSILIIWMMVSLRAFNGAVIGSYPSLSSLLLISEYAVARRKLAKQLMLNKIPLLHTLEQSGFTAYASEKPVCRRSFDNELSWQAPRR